MIVRHNFPFCEPDFAGCQGSQIEFKTVMEAPRLYSSIDHWRVFGGGERLRDRNPCHSYLIARIPGMEIYG